jgi:hypothetical protein
LSFAETLSGLVSIGAFGWVDNFQEQHLRLLDPSQKAHHLLLCLQRWLQVLLDLLVAGLVVLLLVIVVQLRASINPGLVGLGLLNIMSINVNLAGLIEQWTVLGLIGRYLEAERLRRIDGTRSQVPREPGTGNILACEGCNFPSKASL